ncbi:MAG: hypothetical protein LBS24_00045 [Clostridiales Family XIII bacterium]|jgi:hypothetical protein|nr:hypothetical protein [Clostridiales Family XIII bacterium]
MGLLDGAAGNIGGDLAHSILGDVKPAYIVVHDFREVAASEGGKLDPFAVKRALTGPVAAAEGGVREKIFRVQYNPSELEVNAMSHTVEVRDVRGAEGSASSGVLSENLLAGKLELNAVLWFDKMTAANAFMMAKDPLPTNLSSGVRNIAGKLMQEESVQTEVEGFIAALRNPYTQTVTLHWSDFTFTGVIINVNARYTMFSVSGLPVRAKVTIRVRQEVDKGNAEDFFKDFETAFSGDRSNLVLAEQRVSNLLNLDL